MNTDSTNKWLTLAANVGVLIGLLLYQQMFEQWQILGRDTEPLFNWVDSSIEDRPGLRKELVRIVEIDRDAAFARTILESHPELLVED